MKKAKKWLGRIVISLLITIGLAPILLYGFIFIGFKCLEWEADSLNDPAEKALREVGFFEYSEEAVPRYDLTIDGVMTVFELGVTIPADDERWHIAPVASAEYAQQLEALAPEAAFLLPDEELVFDAWCVSGADKRAYFDAETGLLIYIHPAKTPSADAQQIGTLSVPHNGWMYEMETHSGLFGDGATYLAFIVPEAERTGLTAGLANHADWRAGTVTYAEYVHLHNHEFYEVPPLYPASDIAFDWWCYVDTFARNHPNFESEYTPDNSDFPTVMREAGARPGGNWLVALYDADTGLFIYYEFDS